MKSIRRFMGAMALLLATAGTVGCVAGISAMWMFHTSMYERVVKTAAAVDGGLERASSTIQNVQRAVRKARADVAQVRKESAGVGNRADKTPRVSRAVRTLIQQQVGPDVEELGGRLATLGDAAVAVSSVLQTFQELPLSGAVHLKPDRFESWADEVKQLSASLRRLEDMVGDGDTEADGREVTAATSDVDVALQKCQEKVGQWQSDLDAVREQVQGFTSAILRWWTALAIAVTFLLVWVATGQISLFAHALGWFRKA